MGTWGTGIFSNDTACDIRDTYEELLCYGHAPESAEQHVLKEFEMDINHPEKDTDAWIALAATEWRCGRMLSDAVRQVALTLIKQCELSTLCGTEKQKSNRKKALNQLYGHLNSPLPRPKCLKPQPALLSPWNVGDVVALRLPENSKYPALSGKYALILITEIDKVKVSRYAPENLTTDTPYFIIYYWWSDDLFRCAEAIAQETFVLFNKQSAQPDVDVMSQDLFQAFPLYSDEMDLYLQHPVVGHVVLPDLAPICSQYQYDHSVGLSQMSTLLSIQHWIAHADPVRLFNS